MYRIFLMLFNIEYCPVWSCVVSKDWPSKDLSPRPTRTRQITYYYYVDTTHLNSFKLLTVCPSLARAAQNRSMDCTILKALRRRELTHFGLLDYFCRQIFFQESILNFEKFERVPLRVFFLRWLLLCPSWLSFRFSTHFDFWLDTKKAIQQT